MATQHKRKLHEVIKENQKLRTINSRLMDEKEILVKGKLAGIGGNGMLSVNQETLDKFKAMKEENEKLKEKIDAAEGEINNKQDYIEELQEERDELEEAITNIKEEMSNNLSDHEEVKQELQEEINKLKEAVKSEYNQKINLEQEFKKLKEVVKSEYNQKINLEQEIKKLKEDDNQPKKAGGDNYQDMALSYVVNQLRLKDEKINDLEEELLKGVEVCGGAKESMEEMFDKIKELEEEIKKEKDDAEGNDTFCFQKIKELEEENNKLKQEIKNQPTMDNPLHPTWLQNKKLEGEIEKLKQEIKNVKRSKVTGKRLSKEDKELMKKIIDDVESMNEGDADSDYSGNYDIKIKLLKRLIS